MRVYGVVATALLVTVAACGRSPLGKQRSANASHGGNSASGSGGTMNGTGGSAGTGGSTGTTRTGGAVGSGGAAAGGTGGTSGTTRTGGAVGSGGSSATGGTRTTGGSSGVGGAVGTGGFIRTGGAMATGGMIGVGGTTMLGSMHGGSIGSGGRLGLGGASGGTISTGGRSATGGAVSSGGTTPSGGASGTGGSCGDGTLGPSEQCDLGAGNRTLPAFWVTQAGQGFAAVPLVGSVSCPYFYSYSSSSAHTGYEAPGASRILLYIDKTTLALSLAFFHGADKDSTGLDQPTSHVQMLFSGLPDTTTVGVSDDPDELLMTSTTTATGFWKFTDNSDGGVLYRFPFPGDWEITIEPSFIDGISTWSWVQSDGSMVKLDLAQPLTIKTYNSPSLCRLDCTTPRCGDGILDGGEICDDGSHPKNGCGSDCLSYP